MTAPIRIAGPDRPASLHKNTPATAVAMATMLDGVIFCVTIRQMKIEVMAKAAMGATLGVVAAIAFDRLREVLR